MRASGPAVVVRHVGEGFVVGDERNPCLFVLILDYYARLDATAARGLGNGPHLGVGIKRRMGEAREVVVGADRHLVGEGLAQSS